MAGGAKAEQSTQRNAADEPMCCPVATKAVILACSDFKFWRYSNSLWLWGYSPIDG